MRCFQYPDCIHPQVCHRQETCLYDSRGVFQESGEVSITAWEELLRPRRTPERAYNPYEHLTPEQLVLFWDWCFSRSILARSDHVRSAYIRNALELAKELETR